MHLLVASSSITLFRFNSVPQITFSWFVIHSVMCCYSCFCIICCTYGLHYVACHLTPYKANQDASWMNADHWRSGHKTKCKQDRQLERVHAAYKTVSSIYYVHSISKCDTQNILNLALFHLKIKAQAKQLAITHQQGKMWIAQRY